MLDGEAPQQEVSEVRRPTCEHRDLEVDGHDAIVPEEQVAEPAIAVVEGGGRLAQGTHRFFQVRAKSFGDLSHAFRHTLRYIIGNLPPRGAECSTRCPEPTGVRRAGQPAGVPQPGAVPPAGMEPGQVLDHGPAIVKGAAVYLIAEACAG